MAFEIKQASRRGISPLIAFYSESGCGKTYSALLLARGLAGSKGKIVVADSESGRASIYADVIPGGFETFELAAPFSPARYVEAIDTIEESGAAVGIIDSGSHEWEGIGGVLDLAATIEEETGKPGLHIWRAPKFEHQKFMQRLLRTKIPFIVCLRAKYKSRQSKDKAGKTQIIKDDVTSPIQAEDFIFEATCHLEILQNHSIILTKCSHPDLRACFPQDKDTPIAIEHGEALARWCAMAGGIAKPAAAAKASEAAATAAVQRPSAANKAVQGLEGELWRICTPIRKPGVKNWDAVNQWLWREEILNAAADPPEKMPGLPAARLEKVIQEAAKKI